MDRVKRAEADKVILNICPFRILREKTQNKKKETVEINNFLAKLLVGFLAGNAKDG